MGLQAENLTGKVFTRLTVVRRSDDTKYKTPAWVCQCHCGATVSIRAMSLKSGATKSCGCLNRENIVAMNTSHGLSEHSAYKNWKAMMARCHDPKDKDFPSYGERGIYVCERWHDLANFVADMGDRPDGTSLERIDNSQGYNAKNCRWATPLEQGANKRNNQRIVVGGVSMHLADVARRFGMTETTVKRRLSAGMTGDQIVSTPVRKYTKASA